MVSTEEDYHREFDAEDYLAGKYHDVDKFYHETLLKGFHEFYSQTGGARGLKILELGCGPVIAYQISAAPFASEIVMADLVECNRDAVQLWLDKSPSAHDWTPFFRYVVQTLEGKKDDEEIVRREEQLRKAVKAVIYCNALEDRPVPQGHEGPYDVILESSILCVVSNTQEEYAEALIRVSKYLKPGGWLISKSPLIEGLRDPLHYYTGGCHDPDVPFVVLNITEEIVRSTWEKAGFTDIKITRSPVDPDNRLMKEGASYSGIAFVSAIKSE